MTIADGLAVRTTLDPARQGFLDHHRIDGTPVLPGVMGIEGFAEVASRCCCRAGRRRGRGRRASWRRASSTATSRARSSCGAPVRDGGDGRWWPTAACSPAARWPARRAARRALHRAGAARPHAAAGAEPASAGRRAGRRGVGADDIYRIYFHGPAYQVLERRGATTAHVVGALAADLPPDHQPAEPAPRRAAADRAVLPDGRASWSSAPTGRLALPTHVGRVVRFAPVPDAGGRWRAVVTPARRAAASTPSWSTTPGTCASRSRATRPSRCPAASTPTRSSRSARRWPMLSRAWSSGRSAGSRSSTAASRRCA